MPPPTDPIDEGVLRELRLGKLVLSEGEDTVDNMGALFFPRNRAESFSD